MLGDHGVAESLVEAEIAGELAADADADFSKSLGLGIVMRPGHQRRSDALALSGGIDRDSPDMKSAGLAIEPQAADWSPVEQSQSPA